METGTELEAVIRDVDGVLAGQIVDASGQDLRPFLITETYLDRLRPSGVRKLRGGALRHLAVDLASRFARGPLAREVVVERSFSRLPPGPRHLFVFGFPWDDQRATVILRHLLAEMTDVALAVTDRVDVFHGLRTEGVPCLWIRTPRLLHRREVPWFGFAPRDRRLLAQGAALMEVADQLLEELRPRSVLTIQDFFLFDQAFARAALRRGVPTVTHQHGQIPSGPASLYKYLFSDRMAVWGRRSARLMEQFVEPSRIWVVGIDRFDGLRSDAPPAAREHLVLGLNPVSESRNLALFQEVTASLQRAGGGARALIPVLKLHPSLDPESWRAHIAAADPVPWRLQEGGNEDLLPRTRFLLASRSTLTLDAAVAGASVLELEEEGTKGALPEFFDELKESVVAPGDVGAVLAARLAEPALEAALLERQRASLALEIEPGSASMREASALRELDGGQT